MCNYEKCCWIKNAKCFEINHVHDTTEAEVLVCLSFGLLDPKDKENTVRRNDRNYLPDDKWQVPRRLDPLLPLSSGQCTRPQKCFGNGKIKVSAL
jgi:hypothetical protein